MKKDRNAFKAGIFIVVAFVAAVFTLLLIRGEGTGATQLRSVAFTLTDDLGGLSVGDDVRIGGAKVGTVREIEFKGVDSGSPRIQVKFSIPAEYKLRSGAHLGVQASLTGSPNLNITALGKGDPLPDDAILTGEPDAKTALVESLRQTTPHLQAIVANIESHTLPKLNDTVDSANTLVHHVNDKIDPVVTRYDGVAQKAGDALAQVRDLVGESKTDFRGTVKNLNEATASVREKLPPLMDKITGVIDKVDGAVNSARTSLADVEKTAANARDITASARSVIVDNRTKFDTIVKALKSTSDNLQQTSVEVRHSPWRLLYKPAPDEMANLNLYDTARQFAEGANNLSDAAAALRDAMHDPNVDKTQLQKLVGQLDDTFKNFHTAEDKLWRSVKQ